MIKTVVFLTQSHLKWISREAFLAVRAASVRLVLVAHQDEDVCSSIAMYLDESVRLQGCLTEDVLPILYPNEILEVVRNEVERAGDATAVRLFCQEECHLLHAANIREQLGIPGDLPGVVVGFRNKMLMKQKVQGAGLRTPKHASFDVAAAIKRPEQAYQGLCHELGSKLVIKPVDAAGSLNVFVIDSFRDFVSAVLKITASEYTFRYEVDEFIEATMYQCDSIVHDTRIIFSSTAELGCTNFDFVRGKPLTAFPISDSALLQKIALYNERVITALGMRNGCTHHEFFLRNSDSEPIFLEIACRASGGAGVHFHSRNKNFNMIDCYFYQNSLPHLVSEMRIEEKNNTITALLPVGNGRIVALNEPAVISPYEIKWNVAVGAIVSSLTVLDHAGILTLCNDNAAELRADFDALQRYQAVTCSSNTAAPG